MGLGHNGFILAGLIAFGLLAWGQSLTAEAAPAPASAASIADKRTATLAYLRELSPRRQTLTGVQVNEYEVYIECTSLDRVAQQVHQRPAMIGLEGMSAIAYPSYWQYLVDRALAQASAGGLVTARLR